MLNPSAGNGNSCRQTCTLHCPWRSSPISCKWPHVYCPLSVASLVMILYVWYQQITKLSQIYDELLSSVCPSQLMLARTMRHCLMMSSTLDCGKNVQLARYVVATRLQEVRRNIRHLRPYMCISLMAGVSWSYRRIHERCGANLRWESPHSGESDFQCTIVAMSDQFTRHKM
jgi:hypothetical protein